MLRAIDEVCPSPFSCALMAFLCKRALFSNTKIDRWGVLSRFSAVFLTADILMDFPGLKVLVYKPTNVTTKPVTSPWTRLSVCISVKAEKPMIVHEKKKDLFQLFVSRVIDCCFYITEGQFPALAVGSSKRHSGSTTEGTCWCVTSLTFYCQFERMSWLVLLFLYKKSYKWRVGRSFEVLTVSATSVPSWSGRVVLELDRLCAMSVVKP